MTDYSNKEENYGWKRYMLLRCLHPVAFAEFCSTIHIDKLESEVQKLIPEIEHLHIDEKLFYEQFESYKTYFIDFIQRTKNAIINDNMNDILPTEERYIIMAKEFIIK